MPRVRSYRAWSKEPFKSNTNDLFCCPINIIIFGAHNKKSAFELCANFGCSIVITFIYWEQSTDLCPSLHSFLLDCICFYLLSWQCVWTNVPKLKLGNRFKWYLPVHSKRNNAQYPLIKLWPDWWTESKLSFIKGQRKKQRLIKAIQWKKIFFCYWMREKMVICNI